MRIFGTKVRPRMSIFRSNRHIFAQVIDDSQGQTLVSASDLELKEDGKQAKKGSRTEIARRVGELLAKRAIKKKISKIAYDRGGYKYLGRIKSLAEGAREGGLEF